MAKTKEGKVQTTTTYGRAFRVVNGALYVEAEDVQKEMQELHRKTECLFTR